MALCKCHYGAQAGESGRNRDEMSSVAIRELVPVALLRRGGLDLSGQAIQPASSGNCLRFHYETRVEHDVAGEDLLSGCDRLR